MILFQQVSTMFYALSTQECLVSQPCVLCALKVYHFVVQQEVDEHWMSQLQALLPLVPLNWSAWFCFFNCVRYISTLSNVLRNWLAVSCSVTSKMIPANYFSTLRTSSIYRQWSFVPGHHCRYSNSSTIYYYNINNGYLAGQTVINANNTKWDSGRCRRFHVTAAQLIDDCRWSRHQSASSSSSTIRCYDMPKPV